MVKLWGNRHFHTLLVECKFINSSGGKLATPHKSYRYIYLSIQKSPSAGIDPEAMPPVKQKYIRRSLFITALFVIVKYWKQLKCPHMGKWLNKLGPSKWNTMYLLKKRMRKTSANWYGTNFRTCDLFIFSNGQSIYNILPFM